MRIRDALIFDRPSSAYPVGDKKGLDDRNDGCQTPPLSGRPYRI